MKILKLSLKNINALQGEWHIDLGGRGLFAIVGDTGAGKTTILDAICLALYGRTPRLDNISTNQNELMHKGSGEMSVEVELLVADKRYLFRFYQKRARGRADGKLQNIEHTISYEKEGAFCPYVLKKTDIQKKTQAILGMDFEQFTRSVLLAQGDFARFLHSDTKSRGAMLENITDSGIYRRISSYVYDEYKAQEDKLKQLQQSLFALNNNATLHSEKQTQQQLASAQSEYERTQQQLQQLTIHQKAIQDYKNYQQQHITLTEQLVTAQQKLDEFAGQKTALERHQKAAWAHSDYQAWYDNQQQQAHLATYISAAQQKQQHLKNAITQGITKLQTAKDKLAQKNQAFENHDLPNLTKALDIDQALLNHRGNLSHYQQQKNDLVQDKQTIQEDSKRTQDTLDQLSVLLAQHKVILDDEQKKYLSDHLSDIKEHSVALEQTSVDYNITLASLKQARRATAHTQEYISDIKDAIAKLQNEQQQKQQAYNDSHQRLSSLLTGDYAHTRQQIQATLFALDGLHQKSSDCVKQHQALSQKQQEIDGLALALETKAKVLQKAQAAFDNAKQYSELVKENIILKKRLSQLQDNDPCPLCGSLHHPYKDSVIDDNTNPMLERLNQATAHLAHTQKEYDQTQSKLTQAQWQHSTQQKTLITQQKALTDELTQHSIGCDGGDCQALCHTLATEQKKQQQHLNALDHAYHQQQNNKEALARNATELQHIGHQMELAQKDLHNHKHNTDCHQQTLIAQKKSLMDSFSKLNDITYLQQALPTTCPWCDDAPIPDSYFDTLRDFFREASHQKKLYEETLATNFETKHNQHHLTKQLDYQKHHLASLDKKAQQLNANIAAAEQTITDLQTQRRRIISDEQDPQTCLDGLKEALYTAKRNVFQQESKQEQLQAQDKELTDELTKAITEQEQSIAVGVALKQTLDNTLLTSGFTDTADYLGALLDPQTAAHLSTTYTALLDEQKRLLVALDLVQKNIDTLICDHPNISTPQQDIAKDIAQLQQIQQTLSDNVSDLLAQQKIITQHKQEVERLCFAIAQHKKDHKTLCLLNELIGSADGKKFSHYIQELHLAQLLVYANHQLQKMGDRYELIPSADDKNKLGIDIIDHYQNCTRSSHNLSGGEQFIVSLALALGLSQFSSQNNPIDSLFLDEGFGTLDEKHLTIALSTLSELQLSGKTIGVISHMSSLKEQINDQIHLKKLGGGKSAISGAGVVAID